MSRLVYISPPQYLLVVSSRKWLLKYPSLLLLHVTFVDLSKRLLTTAFLSLNAVQLAEEGPGEAHCGAPGAEGADGLHVGEAPWPCT